MCSAVVSAMGPQCFLSIALISLPLGDVDFLAVCFQVCVLCGYGEGAMTRAKKSGVLAKGLLQAWQDKKDAERLNFTHCTSSTAVDIDRLHSNSCQCHGSNGQTNCKLHGVLKKDEGGTELLQEDCNAGRNSVIDGINDPTVAQWVHVVCALWMPGTRCINVETMAAFDVSGVGSAPRKWVCTSQFGNLLKVDPESISFKALKLFPLFVALI